jgi:hypothetical protein
MIERNNIENKNSLYEYYYLIIFCVILLQLFVLPGIRLGVVSSLLIFIVIYKNVNKYDLLNNKTINKLVLVYLIYNTVSVINYIFLDIPLSVYFAEFSNSILPIFFFYFSKKGETSNARFYYVTLWVLIISFLLGYFLWINDSEEYKIFMETTEGPGTGIDFFQSLYGLTATGAFGVIGFLISANLVINSHGKHGKIAMIICILATIFTFRRGSIVSLFIAFIVLHFVAYFKFNFVKFRYFFLEIFFLIAVFKYLLGDFNFFFENLIERSSMISEAVGERSFTWSVAFQDWGFIFGRGLGTLGHKAIGFSKVLIADGNYFKMIGEIGIIGSFIFLMILIFSFSRGILYFKNTFLDLGIVFCICLIAVGSNIFTYQSIAPIFWFSIGRLANFKNSLS